MYKLQGNDIQKAKGLFEKYTSNQSVIFSVFENQLNGCVYVDDIDEMNWALLQTPVYQHFIAGNQTEGCADEIENTLFNVILNEQVEKEIVVFSDTDNWHNVLREVFQKHNGVSDSRKIFDFSHKSFREAVRPKLQDGAKVLLDKRVVLPFSNFETWTAKVIVDGQTASHCDAIMAGKGKAEIDIGTEEAFRGNGYAKAAAFALIDKLLSEGLTPAWSAWPYRLESQHIAKKLGFISAPDAKAWIWQAGM